MDPCIHICGCPGLLVYIDAGGRVSYVCVCLYMSGAESVVEIEEDLKMRSKSSFGLSSLFYRFLFQ